MKKLLLVMLLGATALAQGPRMLTAGDLGEVVKATSSAKIEPAANFRLEAGVSLGRFDFSGWTDEYAENLRFFRPASPVYLASAFGLKEIDIPACTLTFTCKSGKTVTVHVPAFKISKIPDKKWTAADGHAYPDHRLYLGQDGRLYEDDKGTKPVK